VGWLFQHHDGLNCSLDDKSLKRFCGYHHHIRLNTWQGEDAPLPPADALGLRYFTVELPDQKALDDVIARVEKAGISANQTEEELLLYDPSQNGVILTLAKN
jgi:catechol 2,3-dioxygenase